MKKLMLPLFALMNLAFLSCSQQNSNETRFINYEQADSIHIDPADPASPQCKINTSLFYPEKLPASLSIDSIRAMINQLAFGSSTLPLEPDLAYKAYADSLKDEYRKMVQTYQEWPTDDERPQSFFTWEFLYKSTYDITPSGYLSYLIDHYSYTGGAHGIKRKLTAVVDISTSHRQTLTDLFKPSAIKELSALISQRITDHLGVDGVFDEFVRSGVVVVQPTDNFYLTAKEIIFIYNPYEIAPYSAGIVEISLPLTDLKKMVNEQVRLF